MHRSVKGISEISEIYIAVRMGTPHVHASACTCVRAHGGVNALSSCASRREG